MSYVIQVVLGDYSTQVSLPIIASDLEEPC